MNNLNKVEDFLGKVFGKWTVLEEVAVKNGNRRFICCCECGRKKEVDGYRLRNIQSRSCPNCRNKTHGKTYTKTFKVWRDMLGRCINLNHKSYQYYGGRGIKVCEAWLKFEKFLEDMGESPVGLQIDRVDNNGNYEPGNCRWVTPQQNITNRRNSKARV